MMDRPGPSWGNVAPQIVESAKSPCSPENIVQNLPRVGVEYSVRIRLESSSEDKYEAAFSEKDDDNLPVNNSAPVEKISPVCYGYVDDYIEILISDYILAGTCIY